MHARDAKRAQIKLVSTRTQGPQRDGDRPVFEHLLWRYRSAVDCHRDRCSGCRRPEYGISHIITIFIAKFRLKLKKVAKTTRTFRYDLNQIPMIIQWN